MASISTVALVGAAGNLGAPVLQKLLDAGFKVIVLTRQGGTSASSLASHPHQTIKEVDYTSKESLVNALKGADAVVSTISTFAIGDQNLLIEAALEVGAKRFIPSDFGSDLEHPANAKLPVFQGKIATIKYLSELSARHPQFTYTTIMNSAFLDWGLDVGFIVNPKNHTATLWNGGDRPFSTTTLATIADAVVAVLKNPDATANKELKIQDAVVTQNQLIAMVKKIDGQEWETTVKTTQAQEEESYAELRKESPDYQTAMYGFIMPAIFGEDRGPFSPLANDMLGLKQMTEEEVFAVVKKVVQG